MRVLKIGPTDCPSLDLEPTSTNIIHVGVVGCYENSSALYSEIKEKPTNLGKTPKVAKPVPPWHRKYRK